MKTTRILKRYAGMSLCLCLLGAGVTGCIKDDDVAGQKETTLTLTVSTRADDPSQTDNGGKTLESNEEMKTLRVIVARQKGNEIIYNWYEDNIADNDFQRTINFSELTIETTGEPFDFYAIANEASLDLSQAGITSLEGKDVNLTALKSCIINRDYNVRTAGNIPQTAFKPVSVVPGTSDDFTMQLEFVVAKVEFIVVNATQSSQNISNIVLSNASTQSTTLFPSDNVLSAGSEDVNLDNVSVQAGATSDPVSAYFYESRRDEASPYGFTAWWGRRQSVDLSDVAELPRGKKLRIMVTLNSPSVAEFEYEVLDWNDVTVNIPDFN